jgi:hypothetical protein
MSIGRIDLKLNVNITMIFERKDINLIFKTIIILNE